MTFIDESKPLRNMLLEDDHDDIEFHPPQTNRDGAGSWQRKRQNFAFNQALAPDPKIDRMRDVWDKGNLFEEGGDAWFKTRAAVGLDDINGQFDVAKTETLLDQAGVYDHKAVKGPTGIFSYFQQDAIKQYQTDKGLRVDGRMAPNGETMRALKTQLTPKLNALAAAAKAAKAAEAEKVAPVESETVRVADRNQHGPGKNDAQSNGLLGTGSAKPETDIPISSNTQSLETTDISESNSTHVTEPTPQTAPKQHKKFMDHVEKQYRGYVAEFRKKGWKQAAENLERFLNGSGEELKFTREQARKFGPVQTGETRNRERFESRTFVAKTGIPEHNKRLLNLKDGKPESFEDKINYDQGPGRSFLTTATSGPGFYLAFGRTKIKSIVKFEAIREGGVVHIKGTVTHFWKDKYDFDKWQPGADGALSLQKHRGAKPYDINGEWKQEFSGTVKFSGNILSNPQIKWRDVEGPKSK